MAQKYLVQLIDDLSQDQIEDGAGESAAFGVDGASYAIDLTGEHAAEFRALLESEHVDSSLQGSPPRRRPRARRVPLPLSRI